MEMFSYFIVHQSHLGVCLKYRYVSPIPKDSVSVSLMWGLGICGDLNYFSFLITQYVNILPPCKILKHYLISYDCIQLQAILKNLTVI